ncbi:MAG: LapA family protein [bacterium]
MWIVRWVFVAAIIILILLFSLQNQEERVIVHIGKWVSPELPLYFALFVAFAIGLLVWFIVATFQLVRVKSELKSCRRENRRLGEELTALRNLPLEESEEGPKPEQRP